MVKDGPVWASKVLEKTKKGVEDEVDGAGADPDEGGAGDGDDVVVVEILGGSTGAMRQLHDGTAAGGFGQQLLACHGMSVMARETYPGCEPLDQATDQARVAVHCAVKRARAQAKRGADRCLLMMGFCGTGLVVDCQDCPSCAVRASWHHGKLLLFGSGSTPMWVEVSTTTYPLSQPASLSGGKGRSERKESEYVIGVALEGVI